MTSVNLLVRQSTWAIILSAIALSFIYPAFGLSIKPYLNYLLGTMMFLSCLELNVSEIVQNISDIKTQFFSLLIIHLVPPFFVFLLKPYFSPEIYLGLIIATVIPAGRSAVFLSQIYGGHPTKALVTTSLSNILAPITVPILTWFFAHTTVKIDMITMSSTILLLVAIPLVLGFLFGKTTPGKNLNRFTPTISTLILFFIINGIISPIKDIALANPPLTLTLLLIICFLVTINFCLGFITHRNYPDQITYGLSNSYKNFTLSTLLSLTIFTPTVALPSIIYAIANNLMLIPVQFIASRHRDII